MKRDVDRTIAKGSMITRKNPRRDLKTGEAAILRQRFEKDAAENGVSYAIWDTILDAYRFGVAVGYGIATDKITKMDSVDYYNLCKKLNVPLDTFLQAEEGAQV